MFYFVVFFSALLTPELKSIIDTADKDQKIPVLVMMAEEYPFELLAGLPWKDRAAILKEVASRSQSPLREFLSQFPDEVTGLRQFWIFNGFYMETTKRVIGMIAMREDVSLISHVQKISPPPIESSVASIDRAIEWNIKKIMADSCWHHGYTGQNVFIGHIDTGVDFNHPALQGKWGGKWRDFIYNVPYPFDDIGHGTAIAGIICGGDGLGPFENDIGVAPGVKIIPAKVFTYSEIPFSILLAAMEWMASLKADSGYNIRAVSNSWGSPRSLIFWNVCRTWQCLEIFPVFAIGNSGPNPNTTFTPGNYPICIGIGATDSLDLIANFSSRGPAPDSSPWNQPQYWYRSDWNLIKPDIVAPGVNVRSAYNSGNYQSLNGTNIAVPHITGAVAILCEANPTLSITEIYNTLLDNADRPLHGAPYPNNNYGWGRLNIWRALQSILGIEQKKTEGLDIDISIIPNPSFKDVVIKVNLPAHISFVELKIYNLSGRCVKSFYTNRGDQGRIKIHWNGCDEDGRYLPAGVYFVKLNPKSADWLMKSKDEKLILLR